MASEKQVVIIETTYDVGTPSCEAIRKAFIEAGASKCNVELFVRMGKGAIYTYDMEEFVDMDEIEEMIKKNIVDEFASVDVSGAVSKVEWTYINT